MGQVLRYVLADAGVAAVSADAKPVVEVEAAECGHCNYADNYYGDQVCRPRPVS
ncbi:hypothetical protein [Marinobacterium mangrovicola]|uniref:Uncharacterized protein n=1 Tax=Marinobacterium mangrovicola TaxID=1476959 RepID=A0A4R1G2X9_9GAMM|nr:hypothetical protein [Marinobacterium mangrovicola]TCK02307.1 hypothetical protein CLV83_4490 [Marinobacterium mangrovicola]